MTNKLIEFLRDPEAKGLILGNNGFRAERIDGGTVVIRYEGQSICDITPCDVQHELRILPPERVDVCARLTEVFALLGTPQLRLHYHARGAYIQRVHNGLPEAEMSIYNPTVLKVTV